MIQLLDKTNCCGCAGCFNACSINCISMQADEEGFFYPVVDKNRCINCRACERACPFLSDEKNDRLDVTSVYAAKNLDKSKRRASSSGGIFVLLATRILDDGGVVYGTAFSDDFNSVNHIAVTNAAELERMLRSKYVQSNVGKAFQDCRSQLESGKRVLFSGTPCQIDGLKLFLGKKYDNLICVEVICHGVPSQKLWQKYLSELKSANGHVSAVNFRCKKHGWKNFGVSVSFGKKTTFHKKWKDKYLVSFLNNMSLRPSCYACKSKSHKSKADIILGDFWRINSVAPSFYSENGVSMAIINSPAGQALFDEVQSSMERVMVSREELVNHKSAFTKSPKKPVGRDAFYIDAKKSNFRTLNKTYFRISLSKLIRAKLKGLLKRREL